LILELKESVPVKILAINFRQFDGHFSDRTIHILKFEGQSKDNNCPLVLVWRTIGAEGMHEIEYCCRHPSRDGGDTESSGAGNETVKGQ